MTHRAGGECSLHWVAWRGRGQGSGTGPGEDLDPHGEWPCWPPASSGECLCRAGVATGECAYCLTDVFWSLVTQQMELSPQYTWLIGQIRSSCNET